MSAAAQDPLQQLVHARLREMGDVKGPISAREAARRADGAISYDTIYAIANGKHTGNLTTRVAEGLAVALDVPAARVYDAIGSPRTQGKWVPPERLDRLTLRQRQMLEEFGAALLDADADGYARGLNQ